VCKASLDRQVCAPGTRAASKGHCVAKGAPDCRGWLGLHLDVQAPAAGELKPNLEDNRGIG
jgi:hypothetical protein